MSERPKVKRDRRRLYDPVREVDALSKRKDAAEARDLSDKIANPTAEVRPDQPPPLVEVEAKICGEPEQPVASPVEPELVTPSNPAKEPREVLEPEVLIGNLKPTRPSEEQQRQAARRQRIYRAEEIVREHAVWSAPFALIPWPILDAVALTVWQLRMLRKITELYGFGFAPEKGKLWILTLVSSLPPFLLGHFSGKLAGLISPAIGSLVRVGVGGLSAGAATYALGRVFVEYFETGGAFLSFDPEEAAAGFATEYQKAKANGL